MYASTTNAAGTRLYYSLDDTGNICMTEKCVTPTTITNGTYWTWYLGKKYVGIQLDPDRFCKLSTADDAIPARFCLDNGFLRVKYTTPRYDGKLVEQNFHFAGMYAVNPDSQQVPNIFAFARNNVTTVDKPVQGGFWWWIILIVIVIILFVIIAIVFSNTNPDMYDKAKTVISSKLGSVY